MLKQRYIQAKLPYLFQHFIAKPAFKNAFIEFPVFKYIDRPHKPCFKLFFKPSRNFKACGLSALIPMDAFGCCAYFSRKLLLAQAKFFSFVPEAFIIKLNNVPALEIFYSRQLLAEEIAECFKGYYRHIIPLINNAFLQLKRLCFLANNYRRCIQGIPELLQLKSLFGP